MKQSTYQHGEFFLSLKDNLRDMTRNVPNKPGIYLVYALINRVWVIRYFGKAGMTKNGQLMDQGTQNRIRNTRNKMSGEKYFKTKMEEENIQKLKFKWLVTYDELNHVNPCVIEDLLYRRLNAQWNKKRGRPSVQ